MNGPPSQSILDTRRFRVVLELDFEGWWIGD
jgi:hypothetical protein